MLAGLIRAEVEELRDEDLRDAATDEEERGRTLLETTSKGWRDVETFLENGHKS